MAKINLVILDYDERYLKAVSNYLNNNYSEKFYTTIFTERKYLIEHLNNGKKVDILLLNKEVYCEEIEKYDIKAKVILTETKETGIFDKYPLVNKYTAGPRLYEVIIKAYFEQNSEQLDEIISNHTSTKIITLYSPIGGIGKSTLAAALSKELSCRGMEVLYLNLENIQSTDLYFNSEKEVGLSEFIFSIKDRDNNIKKKFIETIQKEEGSNLSYFAPTESTLDIEEIDNDDMKVLLESLLDLQMFDYIIIDTSSKFNSQYKILLNSSNNILFPIGKDNISTLKTNIFLNNITNLENYYFLINKSRSDVNYEIPSVLKRENKQIEQYIPYDTKLSMGTEENLEENPNIDRAVEEIILKLNLV